MSEKMYPSLEKITDGYYAFGEGCARVKLVQDMETRSVDVSVTNIGWNNGCILMDISKEKLPEVKEYMLTNKFIPAFTSKKELYQNIGISAHSYRLVNESAWEIRHPALPVDIADNQFVEDWIEMTFGQYKGFIKKWLSVYCYTNYLRLPMLLLFRAEGKRKEPLRRCRGQHISIPEQYMEGCGLGISWPRRSSSSLMKQCTGETLGSINS